MIQTMQPDSAPVVVRFMSFLLEEVIAIEQVFIQTHQPRRGYSPADQDQ
jgi:hypothetical protein